MGKGKAKRRRETNFKSSHPTAALSKLPPPPSHRDAVAVPSKLRKIIQLKASIHDGHRKELRREANEALKGSKSSKGSVAGISGTTMTLKDKQECAMKDQQQPPPLSDVHDDKVMASGSKKRKRGEDMKTLMDSLRVTPVHKGIREQRKRYLEEKKMKGRRGKGNILPSSLLHQKEVIRFGEVVQAPPKLSAPTKALKQAVSSTVSQERLRQQAVSAYRQRKGWKSRPGFSIPFNPAPELSSM